MKGKSPREAIASLFELHGIPKSRTAWKAKYAEVLIGGHLRAVCLPKNATQFTEAEFAVKRLAEAWRQEQAR